MPPPTRQDFEHLLAFRSSLRRFERWSDALAAGLTHVQHQLLVAIKGTPAAGRRVMFWIALAVWLAVVLALGRWMLPGGQPPAGTASR